MDDTTSSPRPKSINDPVWTRPVLAVIAVVAAFTYIYGTRHQVLEPIYAAAVRSMAHSWHNFFFGAFDPSGTITVDKLPGALWLQAISVRIFGVHIWAYLLPQAIEGILTVLVLYRAVRRLAGPIAGLIAAAVLAVSPVTVALNRGNISDSLLTLLLVLAADATSRALSTGRLRSLLLAGLWVGLAFQAKMVQAWLVLPALGVVYLVAGPGDGRDAALGRLRQLVVAGLVAGVVSLSWMTIVTITPAHDRPYVDGSTHNSIFQQVFSYNGSGRFGNTSTLGKGGTPNVIVEEALNSPLIALQEKTGPSVKTLFVRDIGRTTGWLIPAALVALVGVLVVRRKERRTDPIRAAALLWGVWLLTHAVVFSAASSIHPYYAAVLSPAVAALIGIGVWVAIEATVDASAEAAAVGPVQLVVGVTLAVSGAYAVALAPHHDTFTWLPIAIGAVTVLGEIAVFAPLIPGWGSRRLVGAGVAVAVAAALFAPAVASASIVSERRGAFDTPFEPQSTVRVTQTAPRLLAASIPRTVATFEQIRYGAKDLLATYTSAMASVFIYASGQEVLPIGGETGLVPEPTIAQLRHDIATGQLHQILTPKTTDPRIVWVAKHCRLVRPGPPFDLYFCTKADAG